MEAARNLLDSASIRVEGVLDNDERKRQAPPYSSFVVGTNQGMGEGRGAGEEGEPAQEGEFTLLAAVST